MKPSEDAGHKRTDLQSSTHQLTTPVLAATNLVDQLHHPGCDGRFSYRADIHVALLHARVFNHVAQQVGIENGGISLLLLELSGARWKIRD
jgi:hypothetical protein